MKKYWQIKPWYFIVVFLVLAGGLFYVFGDEDYVGFPKYDIESVSVGSPEVSYMQAMDGDFGMNESYESRGDTEEAIERMIIKTGSLSVVVDDVRKSVEEIVNYVEDKGGFLVTSNIDKSGIDLNGYLTVRVPSDLLEDTMAYIKEMGDVESEHVDGRDITEEYVDLESKLGNLQATEAQFLKIMQSAVKVEDVLAVQKELGYVRGNIETIKGRMKYLDESVDLSSITVYLSTDPSNLPIVDSEDKWRPFAVFKDASRSLLGTGKSVLNGLIWFGVYLPIFIVVLLVGWGIKRHLHRKRGK